MHNKNTNPDFCMQLYVFINLVSSQVGGDRMYNVHYNVLRPILKCPFEDMVYLCIYFQETVILKMCKICSR